MRPYVYLAATFFLASRLGTTERSLRIALWAIVLASGLKAVQGLAVFLQVGHRDPRPDAVLAHEESVFLGIYLLLVLALWWFRCTGTTAHDGDGASCRSCSRRIWRTVGEPRS